MKKQCTHRLLALVLALVMVLSMIPAGVSAAGTTIEGVPETVKVGQNAASQRENSFNIGWKFYYGDNSSASSKNFDDSSWSSVDLPHDFSITQHFTASGEAESGFLPGGTGWYRKSFVLDAAAAGKTFLLNFDGVYMHAYVYVNGEFVGEHHYGYSAFAFDITKYLTCDGITENVVAVKAVNQLPSSRWYSGSGIYRDVTLLALESIHVDRNGVKITTPDIASGNGTANVVTTLVNDSAADVTATVRTTINFRGSEVAQATAQVVVPAGSTAAATAAALVSDPQKWSIETPNLYTAVTEVMVNGTVVDTCEDTFGFRWTEWNSSGFYLNGEPVKLNGVCMHHDQGGLGAAAYYDAMYRQMTIMKDMGVNAIRITHNPGDEDLIAICSELGLLVIEEIFDGLDLAKNGNSNDFSRHFHADADAALYGYASGMTCAEYAARSVFRRDKNAPCIIAWSMGNEIQQDSGSHDSYITIAEHFCSWAASEDGTRPVTIGDNTKAGDGNIVGVLNTILNAGGIAGFNYANSASQLNSLAASYGGVVIASETSSATNSRGQYRNQNNNTNSDGAYHLTSYDTSAVSWGITAHDSLYNTYQYDCIAGEFVWTGFDYIGEPTPWNGTGTGSRTDGRPIPNSSYFGIVETTGFPKDTYYLYRSQWNKDAVTVHLVTAWDADNQYVSGGSTPVWMYSNAPVVKLYLNNILIATSTRQEHTSAADHTYYTYTSVSDDAAVCTVANGSGADGLYGAYNIVYTPGTLKAEACDESGAVLATYAVSTPGDAAKLAASASRTTFPADGSSLIYVQVDVTDANGVLDTTAANNITFTVSGPAVIAAVDNGDQATISKYQNSNVLNEDRTAANINAYAGKALVILRSTEEAGDITLNIASAGLEGQIVNLQAEGGSSTPAEGLVSIEMVRDYSVKTGTEPTLRTAVTGSLADGSTVAGSIAWEEIPADVYNTAGDYTIKGVAAIAGCDPINVSAKLHVIPNVIDLRNISVAAMQGTAPTLPSTVCGVLADGTLAGEFTVAWDNIPTAEDCGTVGELITVTGTAVIFGDETMDVTCTVRVAEALNTESKNVAPTADTLSQDIPAANQSDNLESIRNGTLKPGDNTSERWSNWGNRTNSADATLTLFWNTAVLLSHVNLYYYFDNCCAYPESIEFRYSLNGEDFEVIGHTAEQVETYSLGAMWTYTFDKPINPVKLQVKLTQQSGTTGNNCVGLTELECMTYAASFTMNTSAALSGIAVDGTAIESFTPDTLVYEASNGTVTAATADNAGITVLPAYEGVVRILTVSEDGRFTRTYEIALREDVCTHENTVVLPAVAATCTGTGLTAGAKCADCGEILTEQETVPALGHDFVNGDCTRCDAVEAAPPAVSLDLSANSSGRIVIQGRIDNLANLDDRYQITGRGILYIQASRIGTRTLTVNTSGRTRVNFSNVSADGTFTYNLKPGSKSTSYAFRAFVIYKDTTTGQTVTVYSDMIRGSYNTFK